MLGTKRLTNEAHLWYVPMCVNDVAKVMSVPQMSYTGMEAEEKGRQAYEKQKRERQEHVEVDTPKLLATDTGTQVQAACHGH